MRTDPSHGSAACFEFDWKREALHGTTTFRLSWPAGTCTTKSATTGSPPFAFPVKSTFMRPSSCTFA